MRKMDILVMNIKHPNKIPVAVYDTKPYDRQYFKNAQASDSMEWTFFDFRLSKQTAGTVAGHSVVCIFVNDRVDKECLELLHENGVKHIALRCAGFNNVDLDSAKDFGIQVTRVPAYSPHAVAEHTVALLLTLNRHIHRAHYRVREQNFSLNGLIGFDVFGKTVGIVGTGKIGKLVAQIFRGFGATVLAFDPYPQHEWAREHSLQYVGQDELLSQSDIISLHMPLTHDTLHFFNSTTFSRVKQGAFLINTSRGKLIDTTALIESLKSGHLGGVALDVYEEEEGVFFEDLSGQVLQDEELCRLMTFPNVLMTSHQAFLTREALSEISRVTTENILRGNRGDEFLEGTVVA